MVQFTYWLIENDWSCAHGSTANTHALKRSSYKVYDHKIFFLFLMWCARGRSQCWWHLSDFFSFFFLLLCVQQVNQSYCRLHLICLRLNSIKMLLWTNASPFAWHCESETKKNLNGNWPFRYMKMFIKEMICKSDNSDQNNIEKIRHEWSLNS